MQNLISVTEVYRVGTEAEVEQMLKDMKNDHRFTLSKYTSVQRQKKEKGEIVDEWIRLTVTKVFTDEKEPTEEVSILYEVGNNF